MDSIDIDKPFTIEVAGATIAKVTETDNEEMIQATTGTDAAVFTLKEGHLLSDEWVLGRYVVEDRSLMPKRLLWIKASESGADRLQPVYAEKDGESYKLKFTGSTKVVTAEGKVFVAIISGEDEKDAVVKMQE